MVNGLQIFCEKNEPDFEKEKEELRTLWKNIDQTGYRFTILYVIWAIVLLFLGKNLLATKWPNVISSPL